MSTEWTEMGMDSEPTYDEVLVDGSRSHAVSVPVSALREQFRKAAEALPPLSHASINALGILAGSLSHALAYGQMAKEMERWDRGVAAGTIETLAGHMGLTPQQVEAGIRNYALCHPLSLADALSRAHTQEVRDWIREYVANK